MKKFPHYEIEEFKIFKKLTTPSKIQDFVNSIPINFERSRETNHSPLSVLKLNKAHCMEAALLAACIFWYHNEEPLILDLKAVDHDVSHVIAVFKRRGRWGAISKVNHPYVRFRDPIYKNIRELVLSYFNEYFKKNGEKTLRTYSNPVSLLSLDPEWIISKKNVWHMVQHIDKAPHFKIFEKGSERYLRPMDKIELKADTLLEWEKE